jgi:sulfatase maturation enzyme AslB (radical SAM superfamily)
MKEKFTEEREKFRSFLKKGEAPLNYEKFLLQSDSDKNRVVAILDGKIVPPFEVEIQPSSTCNLKCKHCFGKNYPRLSNKMGKKEFDLLANRIDKFKENGFEIEIVKFCGTTGEPLVNTYTPYALDMFHKREKKVVLFTNGLNLNKKVNSNGRKYYEYLPEIKRINLSFDAG